MPSMAWPTAYKWQLLLTYHVGMQLQVMSHYQCHHRAELAIALHIAMLYSIKYMHCAMNFIVKCSRLLLYRIAVMTKHGQPEFMPDGPYREQQANSHRLSR